jgi:hypothetical protein
MPKGAITAGQRAFLVRLARDIPTSAGMVIAAIVDVDDLDQWTAQQASAFIGRVQAARSPRPALRNQRGDRRDVELPADSAA